MAFDETRSTIEMQSGASRRYNGYLAQQTADGGHSIAFCRPPCGDTCGDRISLGVALAKPIGTIIATLLWE